MTGSTGSTDFPTSNPFQASNRGFENAFVTKLNAAGSALIYSTYLGGSGGDVGIDEGHGIAVDSLGNAYVTGLTTSTNFPTANPFQASKGGFIDAFVTKLNAAGSALLYSTYLGGSGDNEAFGIAVNSLGNAYVTGFTDSTNFPTANPIQSTLGGGFGDAFVAKIAASPAEQLAGLETLVSSIGLPPGTKNSLLAKVRAAAAALARGNTTAACNELGALINEANAQSGKHPAEAAAIIAAAQAIRAALGCS